MSVHRTLIEDFTIPANREHGNVMEGSESHTMVCLAWNGNVECGIWWHGCMATRRYCALKPAQSRKAVQSGEKNWPHCEPRCRNAVLGRGRMCRPFHAAFREENSVNKPDTRRRRDVWPEAGEIGQACNRHLTPQPTFDCETDGALFNIIVQGLEQSCMWPQNAKSFWTQAAETHNAFSSCEQIEPQYEITSHRDRKEPM